MRESLYLQDLLEDQAYELSSWNKKVNVLGVNSTSGQFALNIIVLLPSKPNSGLQWFSISQQGITIKRTIIA